MDGLNDWIYVVFLIVAAVSGLFGSKGKKRQRPVEVLGEPEYSTEWEEPVARKEAEVKPSAPTSAPAETTPKARQQKSSVHQAVAATPMAEEHSMPRDMDLKNTEELKKAVIYSEILSRKY